MLYEVVVELMGFYRIGIVPTYLYEGMSPR
jgi:hypothetical protein